MFPQHINTTKRTPVSKDEIIWNNTNIKINGKKAVLFKSWYDNGVVKMANLLDGNTNLSRIQLKALFHYLFWSYTRYKGNEWTILRCTKIAVTSSNAGMV